MTSDSSSGSGLVSGAAIGACNECSAAEALGIEFDFAYQPIVDLRTRTVFGHEALVRGPNGEGAITVLSQAHAGNRYRFDQACRVKAIKRASELGITELLSINFMPNAMKDPQFCIRTTLEAARAQGVALNRLIFEVSEGERIEDGPLFADILREYRRLGLRTAIDDFGAGYAGMKLLADFQPDIIKIDMAITRGIDHHGSRQIIVRHLVRLCEEMKIDVIAEGIETAAERNYLRDMGIRLMQGYLFARPSFQSIAHVDSAAFG